MVHFVVCKGILVINVAYRAKGLFEEVLKNVRGAFEGVAKLQMETDTNCVLFCSPKSFSLDLVRAMDVNLKQRMKKDAEDESDLSDYVKKLKESLLPPEEVAKESAPTTPSSSTSSGGGGRAKNKKKKK